MKTLRLSLLLSCVSLGFAAEPAAITPRETIALFNGKDLSNFTTWETIHGPEDPDHVFTVVDQIDGAPAIRSSGQHYGGLATKESYANYHLVFEYRWGLITWNPRKDRARDAGVLLHCQGEPGNHQKDFKGPWMRSVEYQIIEGATGDVILVNGYDRGVATPIVPILKAKIDATKHWDPNGTLTEIGTKAGGNRVHVVYKSADWKDVLGFRGPKDVEKPVGEWNRAEVVCKGGDLTYYLNGQKVNELLDSSFREGRLLFQSEGAEIFYRKIELRPLDQAPKS